MSFQLKYIEIPFNTWADYKVLPKKLECFSFDKDRKN